MDTDTDQHRLTSAEFLLSALIRVHLRLLHFILPALG
jgi:hypothetical protein